MKYFIYSVAILTVCFSITLAGAQDKVVVIPLNSCSSSFTKCAGKCVDTTNNPLYCGNCTTACPTASFCDKGKCVGRCDDNNICTDDTYDPTSGCAYTYIPGPDCPCNPVTQDCPATDSACYLQLVTGDASCAEIPAGAIGLVQDDLCYGLTPDSCYLNGCDKGYGANQPDNTCAFFCSPIDNWVGNIQGLAGDPAGITCGATFGGARPDGPGVGYECRYIQSFYSNTELVAETIGMCVSSSTYGTCAVFDWVQLLADIASGAVNAPDYCTNYPERCMTECISLATFNAATALLGSSQKQILYESLFSKTINRSLR